MRNGLDVHEFTRALLRPLGLCVIAVATVLFLSLGCGKKVDDGKNVPAPGAIETPKPPNEPADQTIRGRLQFGSLPSNLRTSKQPFEGFVNGDWDVRRRYIGGHPTSPQRAIWHFDHLPQRLKSPEGDNVSAKLTCSIVHLEPLPVVVEGDPVDPPVPLAKRKRAARGIPVSIKIQVVSHTCPLTPPSEPPNNVNGGQWPWADQTAQAKHQAIQNEYRYDKHIEIRTAKPNTEGWKVVNTLAEDFGYFEVVLDVVDLKVANLNLPAGVFRNALKVNPDADANGKPKRPLVSIYLQCETSDSHLGVAESDLYLDE